MVIISEPVKMLEYLPEVCHFKEANILKQVEYQ